VGRIPLLTTLTLLLPASTAAWEPAPPLRPAVVRARQQARPLLLNVSSSPCPDCAALDRELSRPWLAGLLASYTRLAYDAGQGEGWHVARRYNVVRFPTLLLIGDDGLERGRITGPAPAAALLRRLQAIRGGAETLEALEQRLEREPEDHALRLRLGTAWALRGDRPRAAALLNRLVREARGAGAPAAALYAPRALLVRGHDLELSSLGDRRAARATFKELIASYPGTDEARQARRLLRSMGRRRRGG
jgi:tetratricopeptide (TPR) repeat protein